MPTSFDGLTRRKSAATSVARKHDVPDAVSQLNVNTAAYGAGAGVTGGIRVIALCRPGTFRPFNTVALFGSDGDSTLWVHLSIAPLMDGSPHARTKTTSNK